MNCQMLYVQSKILVMLFLKTFFPFRTITKTLLLIRTILVHIRISFSHYFATKPFVQIRIFFLHYFAHFISKSANRKILSPYRTKDSAIRNEK